jgi:hypothetical protein
MAVLQKIKALQTECQRAGIPVPLDAVLRRDRALRPPGGTGGDAAPAAAKPKDESAARAKKLGKREEAKPQAPAAVLAPETAATAAAAAGTTTTTTTTTTVGEAAGTGQRAVRRPPQTLFEWLHLLSPLLTLIFGILYALTRAAGTGAGAAGE